MGWRGFLGLRSYDHVLQRDLRELERWMTDIETRVAGQTTGEAINFYQTLISGEGLPIYRQSNQPSPGNEPAMWIQINGSGSGDTVYLHVKKPDDTWDWLYLGKA